MSNIDHVEVTIPFSGFYCSHHEAEINREIEQCLSTDDSSDEPDKALAEIFWGSKREGHWGDRNPDIEYGDLFEEYGREFGSEYLGALGFTEIGVPAKCVDSPKFYNFGTDRLFMKLPLRHLIDMLIEVIFDEAAFECFENTISERFTHGSGFISSYPNDLEDWPEDLTEWDHNHWGTLIQAYADHYDLIGEEYDLMEGPQCNGFFSNLVWNHANEDAQRLFELASNLRQRKSRRVAHVE